MNPVQGSLADWLPLIRGEFQEIPGLHLTKPQVQRLWGLDGPTCDELLDALVDGGFLRRTQTGAYVRREPIIEHASQRPRTRRSEGC